MSACLKAGRRNGNRKREEKSWRKEDNNQGDQTKTSTKRKAADVTLPTDVQMCRAEVGERERKKKMWMQGEGGQGNGIS
jgi:hypothetical protein